MKDTYQYFEKLINLAEVSKRDRINEYANQIGKLIPRLYSGKGGQGSEIHELKVLVNLLAEELE